MRAEVQAVSRTVVEDICLHVVSVHILTNAASSGNPEGCDGHQVIAVVMPHTVIVFITCKFVNTSMTLLPTLGSK